MSNLEQAARAYGQLDSQTSDPKRLEYRVFLEVTREIKLCASENADLAKRAIALHKNERLWTEIAVQVADSANKLPKPLRAQLFYLSEFVAYHTQQIRSGLADVSALIEVNVSIMRGLQGRA